ncbi:hypothetical protein GMD42_13665 [Parasutterella excrementihominis]|uniref:Uncharacterized protein n=1 Tax=Parasutterella excrementihominis TaxID=487175 RepID=A0A844LNJ9_9BURK|nr:hypothetical protein [Parasutterella excrementihominis]
MGSRDRLRPGGAALAHVGAARLGRAHDGDPAAWLHRREAGGVDAMGSRGAGIRCRVRYRRRSLRRVGRRNIGA